MNPQYVDLYSRLGIVYAILKGNYIREKKIIVNH